MARPSLVHFDAKSQDKFLALVAPVKDTGCWEWQGRLGPTGYGIFTIKGWSFRAHRLALYRTTGVMHEDLFVLHACDNRKCCNPAHLRWGTHQENQQDKVERGGIRGIKNGRAKINQTDADFIKKSDRPTSQLMEWFGLSKPAINRIRRGDGW